MNGPKHFAEAERLITKGVTWDGNQTRPDGVVIAAAQVHATLAHAAATIEAIAARGPGDVDPDWQEVVR